MIITRQSYLDKLAPFRDKHIIKVLTGVRRAGKSVILEQFKNQLITCGIKENQIQFYNFEEPESTELVKEDWRTIYQHIKHNLCLEEQNYVFLDEVQNVPEFQKLVDGLFVKKNIDLYITGSNAYLLSGQLATLLSGRYVEINVLPLSFAEYLEFYSDKTDLEHKFADYLYNGSFPQAFEFFASNDSAGIDYLRGVYNTVMIKDVVTRNGADDANALQKINRFIFDNVGSLVSPNKIANYMISHHDKIDSRKVEKILSAVSDAYIFYPVNRYDIKGKENLQTLQKYYIVDTGLRRIMLGSDNNADVGYLLENVVYLELLRRGCQVWVGKTKDGKEVDFVAMNKNGRIEYYQVAATMLGEETRERELSSLCNIDDHYQKFIITMDYGEYSYDGIRQVNVIDWLLEKW